jgi:hypothetical protein
MKSYPKVSIIFPNHNGGKEPLECLSSIRDLDYPKSKIEVIVIDNNSSDGSDLNIKEKFPEVLLIKNSKNVFFAKAVNQGILKATGEYIFIGNDDLIFEKDSLKNLIGYSLKNPNVGVLGGKIFYKSHPKKICSAGYMMNKWTGNVYVALSPNKIKEPDWIQGCAMLIPKKVFKKTGLFDSNYTHLFEDYDLCLRAKKAGYKIVYIPFAQFWHGESLTWDKNATDKYYNWYKSKFRFILKNLHLINVLSILLIQVFVISPYRAIILRDRRFIPFLKGVLWNLKNLQQTLSERGK